MSAPLAATGVLEACVHFLFHNRTYLLDLFPSFIKKSCNPTGALEVVTTRLACHRSIALH